MNETEVILSIQPAIHKVVNAFAFRFGLDAEELRQEMQLVALKAIRSFNPDKGTLVPRITTIIAQRLYRKVKFPGFRELYGKKQNYLEEVQEGRFDLERLLIEVSQDAAQAICLVLEEGVDDRDYIETLLHRSYGWTEQRIQCVFIEVRNALS